MITEPKDVLLFSELGVVFLLFIIGLELSPKRLWTLRASIFGLGMLQVVLTGGLFTGVGWMLGLKPSIAFVAGFGLALSSTAFGIQILENARQLKTFHGQGSFSILMFQDLAVVPLLASLSILVGDEATALTTTGIAKAIGTIVLLFVIGRYLLHHALRFIADAQNHELLIATALFIVIGSGILMESVGLSMGMGAFLAGVLLANSEYRHELESNLEPFKGLLLGLFFIAVGMSLDLDILFSNPHWVIALALGFMTIKGLILYGLSRIFKFPHEAARNIAFTLPQGGEFAFVLFNTALATGLLNQDLTSILNASVTISMALTPLIFNFNQKYMRRFSEINERPYDSATTDEAKVIIAGYGRFGQIVSRFLRAEDISHTILEHSASQVDTARRYGSKIFYGDASRLDILTAAGAKKAEIFVLAIDDPITSIKTAKVVREEFPHLHIIARARNRQHVIDLMEMGIEVIHRETLLTSLEVAKEVLMHTGLKREQINKRLALFRSNDEEILRKQFELRGDQNEMISFTIRATEELDQILREDRAKIHPHEETESAAGKPGPNP